MDTNVLMMSLLFGSIGMGLFMYGKKDMRIAYLAAGVALMVFPYFITNMMAMTVVGVLLTAAPFLLP